jgi:hypothetical protein
MASDSDPSITPKTKENTMSNENAADTRHSSRSSGSAGLGIPKAKYTVGDSVMVKCDQVGLFPATVTRVWWDNYRLHMDYEVMEEGGIKTDGYTEDWLSPQNTEPTRSRGSSGDKI